MPEQTYTGPVKGTFKEVGS